MIQHRLENGVLPPFAFAYRLNPVEPSSFGYDIMREDGVVDGLGILEGIVAPELLVTSGVVQERRDAGDFARKAVERLALRDRLGIPDDERRVNALELHHLGQRTVRFAIRVDVGVVEAEYLGIGGHSGSTRQECRAPFPSSI